MVVSETRKEVVREAKVRNPQEEEEVAIRQNRMAWESATARSQCGVQSEQNKRLQTSLQREKFNC